MLKQSNTKFKKLFKGAVFSMACLLSLSGLPLASTFGAFAAPSASAALTMDNTGSISLSGAPKTAEMGVPYTVQNATFKKGGKTLTVKKNDETDETYKTDIKVTYKNTNYTFEIDGENKFKPTLAGDYSITYTVTNKTNASEQYSYVYDIVCEMGEASFKFAENDKNILPSVYDPDVFVEKSVEAKAITLPVPTILDANGNELKNKDEQPVKFYKTKQSGNDAHVVVSVSGGTAETSSEILDTALTVEENGSVTLANTFVEAGEGEYTIKYELIQNGVVVSTTTKTFDMVKGYYKTSSASNAKSGYELSTTWANTTPSSASTGVALKLPAVTGKTTSDNKPADEAVNVYYTVKVTKRDKNGSYTTDVATENVVDGKTKFDQYVDAENNTFTPPEDGDYRFEYDVVDFYGNHSKQSKIFYINGVKDDVKPTVYVYNAKDRDTFTKEENGDVNYVSARQDFKNETLNRNIVLFAIGANDNALGRGITLKREIKDTANITRFSIVDEVPAKGEDNGQVRYNDYNLIFNFDKDKFFEDNYAISEQRESGDLATDAATYLKEHNFLIVTHTYYVPGTEKQLFDFSGIEGNYTEGKQYKDIVADPANTAEFNEEEFKAALLKLGYAYVPYIGNAYEWRTQPYSIYYSATDNAGNSAEEPSINMDVTVSETYTDAAVPTINFPSSLKSNYLPTETITFDAPRFSDTADDSVKGVVMYRYLALADKSEIVAEGLSKDFTLKVNETSALVGESGTSTRWFDKKGSHETHGFITLEPDENGQYSIDLSKRPSEATNAGYIELFVYGVDDYGNMGFYQKEMRITNTGDSRAITLQSVKESDKNDEEFIQGEKIYLPTLVYDDDLVDYVTHTVEVFHVTIGEDSVPTYKRMPSENSSAVRENRIERYTLDAGSFTASFSGQYRAVVTVKDAGNNSIATFFDFDVETNEPVAAPVVDNLTSETISLDVDQSFDLVPPTLSVQERGNVGYAGFEQNDDSKTALYYDVAALTAEENVYELTKYNFIGRMTGTYEIKYNVYLIRYDKSALNENVKLENGDLTFKAKVNDDTGMPDPAGTEKTFTVVPDMVKGEIGIFEGKVDVTDKMKEDSTFKTLKAELITLETSAQRFKVTDNSDPVIHSDKIDTKEYKSRSTVDNEPIVIQRIQASDNSYLGIDPSTSKVSVKRVKANGTTETVDVTMKDWDNERENGFVNYNGKELVLKIDENAEYTITYTVYDYSGRSATYSIPSIKIGDLVKPKVDDIKDGFFSKKKEEYKRGDTVYLDAEKLVLSDNSQTDDNKAEVQETLLKNVSITVSNEAGSVDVTRDENVFSFDLETAGTYTITIKTSDGVGNSSIARTETITIASKSAGTSQDVYQTLGTILIVASVAILLGVVTYFIYSKIKLDRELKGTGKKKKNKK